MTKEEWLASRCGNASNAPQEKNDTSDFRLADYTLQVAITLAGYAGHDEDCQWHRSPTVKSCSCGYSEAFRNLRDLMDDPC